LGRLYLLFTGDLEDLVTKKRRNILVVAAIVAVALVMVLFKDGRLGPIDYSGPTADWLDYGNSRGGDR